MAAFPVPTLGSDHAGQGLDEPGSIVPDGREYELSHVAQATRRAARTSGRHRWHGAVDGRCQTDDMRAAVYDEFGAPIRMADVADPTPGPDDAVISVEATGVCRSDWHGWQGHDPDITVLPHVPGHEFAGEIAAIGGRVMKWGVGDRVIVPFIAGCGRCDECLSGSAQVCPDQTQPGFTHWGSFAQFTVARNADFNLVRLPDEIDFPTAAALGCRFTTAYRALTGHGPLEPGEWIAVYGCGGVGLSAVMVAVARGANVIGVDPSPHGRRRAAGLGAVAVAAPEEAAEVIREHTGDGVHVTIDAIGSPTVVAAAINSLRRRGRHVQVGLLPGDGGFGEMAAGRLIGRELSIVGSHGMPAGDFAGLLDLITAGQLHPGELIGAEVSLEDGALALMEMDHGAPDGMTVITTFR